MKSAGIQISISCIWRAWFSHMQETNHILDRNREPSGTDEEIRSRQRCLLGNGVASSGLVSVAGRQSRVWTSRRTRGRSKVCAALWFARRYQAADRQLALVSQESYPLQFN